MDGACRGQALAGIDMGLDKEQDMTIKALGYLGVNATDLDHWQTYGTQVLGMQVVEQGADRLLLRLDEKYCRIAVHRAATDGPAYFGWDVGDLDGLEQSLQVCAKHAAEALECSREEARERGVFALWRAVDPAGNRLELFYGQASGYAFHPGRDVSGFRTGHLGLGHVVLLTNCLERMMAFYGDLGFRLSDVIHMQMFGVDAHFLHCNPRHHSLAMIEAPVNGMHHLMLEVNNLLDVGTGLEACHKHGVELRLTLGQHTNDEMISFYHRSPAGFEVEYGCHGITIDREELWSVVEYDGVSHWGHRPPAAPATSA